MNKTPDFTHAKFIKTAIWPKDYPPMSSSSGAPMSEIGIVGRSNVGKSSLLNHLFRKKNLVKTSSIPGKTQAINFFHVGDLLSFVDLPGYGYAKVPKKIKDQWGPMIESYLDNRPSLRLILFLIDIRRTPNADDMNFLEWAEYRKIPIILILTKVDKVKAKERKANTTKILDAFSWDKKPYIPYSITKNIGRTLLINNIFKEIKEKKWDY